MKLVIKINSLKGVKVVNNTFKKDFTNKNDIEFLLIGYDNSEVGVVHYSENATIKVDFEGCYEDSDELLFKLSCVSNSISQITQECWSTHLEILEKDVEDGIFPEYGLSKEFVDIFSDNLSGGVDDWYFAQNG